MSKEDVLRNVISALSDYLRDHFVAIWQIPPIRDDTPSIGSGTCIEINSRLFIATAAHNFRDIPRGGRVTLISGRGSTDTPLKDIGHNYSGHGAPGTLDVAWIEIDRESAAKSNLAGIPLRLIDPSHTLDDAYYSITGTPIEKAKIDITNREARITVPPIIYYTHAAERPAKTDVQVDLFLNYPPEAINAEGPTTSDDPPGLSGGGIWHTPSMSDSQVWSPAAYPLVGIPVVFFSQSRQIGGLQMHRWFRLLLADHPELREQVEPLLQTEP